jgi:hypothetical protein
VRKEVITDQGGGQRRHPGTFETAIGSVSMDIQTQLRHAAKAIRESGVAPADRGSVAGMMLRAAQDIDSLSFTVQQYRDEYEGAERKQEHTA